MKKTKQLKCTLLAGLVLAGGLGVNVVRAQVYENPVTYTKSYGIQEGENSTYKENVTVNVNSTDPWMVVGVGGQNLGAGMGKASHVVFEKDLIMVGTSDDPMKKEYWGVVGGGYSGGYPNYRGSVFAPKAVVMSHGESASIDVKGNVNIRSRGHGILSSAGWYMRDRDNTKNAIINIGGGTVITPTTEQMVGEDHYETLGFLALGSYGGTVNMNMNADLTGPGTRDVNLVGHISASHNDNPPKPGDPLDGMHGQTYNAVFFQDGRVNLGLSTPNSTWRGMVTNSGTKQIGDLNFWISNGATWTHEAVSNPNVTDVDTMPDPSNIMYGRYDGKSHVTRLTGGATEATRGVFVQKENAPLIIENYAGHMLFVYEHTMEDNGTRANHASYGDKIINVIGGDVKISKAKAGSGVTLRTDSTGLNTASSANGLEKNLVSDTLNHLAGKMYYIANDGNLKGKVEIAEGILSSSASKRFENITFKKNDGQGEYRYTLEDATGTLPPTPEPDVPTPDVPTPPPSPEEPVPDPGESDADFTVSITGIKADDQKYVDANVLNDEGENYVFTKDTLIKANSGVKLKNLDHAVTIHGGDKTLTFEAMLPEEADLVDLIDVRSLKPLTMEAKKLVLKADSKGRAEGIHVGGSIEHNKTTPFTVTINSDVDANIHGKESALGLYSVGNGEITINGNVTMKGSGTEGNDRWGVWSDKGGYAYYGVSAIYAGNDYKVQMGPTIKVKGLVDLVVNGNGVFVNGGSSDVEVNGGNIEINRENSKNYFGLLSQSSNISMNVKRDSDKIATSADVYKVTLKGNVGALAGAINPSEPEVNTRVSLGLSTHDSSWTGIAYNVFPSEGLSDGKKMNFGYIDLFLQNGATWTNEQWGALPPNTGSAAPYTGSHVTKLVGGNSAENRGVIVQKDKDSITIDNYSGHTLFIYKHEMADDTTREFHESYGDKIANMVGGDVTIRKGADGSAVTLRTDATGLNTEENATWQEKNLVNDTLDRLANKLFYTANDGKLTGEVEIAEGLLSSSVSKRLENMTFKQENGQGEYKYVLETDAPSPEPGEQTKTEFGTSITGIKADDQEYVNAGVLKDEGENYIFTKNAVIRTNQGVNVKDVDHAVMIQAEDKTLTFEAMLPEEADLVDLIDVRSLKPLTMEAKKLVLKADGKGRAEAIHVGGNIAHNNTTPFNVTINSDVDANVHGKEAAMGVYSVGNGEVTINGNVTMKGNGTEGNDRWGVWSDAGGYEYYGVSAIYAGNDYKIQMGPTIKVKGLVDLVVNGNGVFVNGGSSDVEVNGGNIEINRENSKNYFGLLSQSSNISMNVKRDSDKIATSADVYKVTLKGNVGALAGAVNASEPEANSRVSLGLSTPDSSWVGVAYNAFPDEGLDDGKKKNFGDITLFLQNGATWTNEQWGPLPKAYSGKNYAGSHVTKLAGGDSVENRGVIVQNDKDPITIDNYSGHTLFLYKHEIAEDTTRENHESYGDKIANMVGGDVTIRKVADGSAVTLRTDAMGLNTEASANWKEKNLVNDTLDRLANKLYYTANDGKLTGKVEIAEGLLSSSVSKRLEDMTFKAENGQGEYKYTLETETPDPGPNPDPDPNPNPNPDSDLGIEYGDNETMMMKGSKSAMASAMVMWRNSNNDLQKRMGDIRLSPETSGIWAKYFGGKNTLDDQKAYVKQDYNFAQVGYDKKVGDWNMGVALDYGTANDTYINGSKGNPEMISFALYGSKQQADGTYVDIIAKGSHLKNEYTIIGDMNHQLKGDYKTWGGALTVEYGKRMERENGFYLEPSVSFTAGRLAGKTYDATSDYKNPDGSMQMLHIDQSGVTTAIGRIGVGIGKQTPMSNVFAKVGLAHEFSGELKTTFSTGNTKKEVSLDFSDTWVDLELGGSYLVNKDTYLYGVFSKNFGATIENDWRVDAGVRFSF